jgi:hypothetical protein
VRQTRASTYQTKRKLQIIREWKRWLQAHSIERRAATPRHTLNFFYELQDKRSPLLKFQPRGRDKWAIVNGWLLDESPSKRDCQRCAPLADVEL